MHLLLFITSELKEHLIKVQFEFRRQTPCSPLRLCFYLSSSGLARVINHLLDMIFLKYRNIQQMLFKGNHSQSQLSV